MCAAEDFRRASFGAARSKASAGHTHSRSDDMALPRRRPHGSARHERRGARRFCRLHVCRSISSSASTAQVPHAALGNAARGVPPAAPSPRSTRPADFTSSPPSSNSFVLYRRWQGSCRPSLYLSVGAPTGRPRRGSSSPRFAPPASSPISSPARIWASAKVRIHHLAPEPALKAADTQAVIARELVRAAAFRLGHRRDLLLANAGR